MKQLLCKIMGSIVEILTCCDPFPVVTKEQKNEKERPDGGAARRSPGLQDT